MLREKCKLGADSKCFYLAQPTLFSTSFNTSKNHVKVLFCCAQLGFKAYVITEGLLLPVKVEQVNSEVVHALAKFLQES